MKMTEAPVVRHDFQSGMKFLMVPPVLNDWRIRARRLPANTKQNCHTRSNTNLSEARQGKQHRDARAS
eukprot:2572344-Pleurochrysis_carterae.AAC.2